MRETYSFYCILYLKSEFINAYSVTVNKDIIYLYSVRCVIIQCFILTEVRGI